MNEHPGSDDAPPRVSDPGVAEPEPSEASRRRRTVEVVGAAILDRGRCLVAQRGEGMSNAFEWELPGGKVEPGEDPRQALHREIQEELGLEIRLGPWLGRSLVPLRRAELQLDVYVATLAGGTLRLAEHHTTAWHGPETLPTLRWSRADAPLLPRLIEHLKHAENPD